MKDSLSLLRHKIQDSSLAFQDATMNAVVTLAAIEVLIIFPINRCKSLTFVILAWKGKPSCEHDAYRWGQKNGHC